MSGWGLGQTPPGLCCKERVEAGPHPALELAMVGS